ncbi:protein kinase domain-containing protein [Stieleria magnilauensis]|uniref:Serine/threonine-protein kinase PrkC n=1 Tax=Stieleria magnilauensis TaxID=2527963 RepID=A0ABX5XUK2_9BACT|nr:Serine/threonine-protein kinase PrkC [Planctomycetes bacterium TBK1r]
MSSSSIAKEPKYVSRQSRAIDPLAATLVQELNAAWQDDHLFRAETLLRQHALDGDNARIVIPLVYEEVCLREQAGQAVDQAELKHRFPGLVTELELLFDCHRLLAFPEDSVKYPEVGQRIGEFDLVAELGRGAVGRVFLATQPVLSDRPVVLKITADEGVEHLSLARLQHTGIVPVYGVQEFPQQRLRVLCMPYLGGVTLRHLLAQIRSIPIARRTGEDIVEVLRQYEQDEPIDLDAARFQGPALQFLSRATYQQAVCWIGACLADALHYAHQRGLWHLDVKPSNVLLTSDGQPMLLDFHLAKKSSESISGPLDSIGGTDGYMSPEQQVCLDNICAGRVSTDDMAIRTVDQRSDLFSLGVLLYELLGGVVASDATDATTTASIRSNDEAWTSGRIAVDRRLRRIVERCLQSEPERRYADAQTLANELRECLAKTGKSAGLPRSKKRQLHVGRWALGLAGVFVLGAITVWMTARASVNRATDSLNHARQLTRHNAFSDAVATLQLGLQEIDWVPFQDKLKRSLDVDLRSVNFSISADRLHQVIEQLRLLDGPRPLPGHQLRQIDTLCAELWGQRERFVSGMAVRSNNQTSKQVRSDLNELAILWTNQRERLAPPGDEESTLREALTTLQEAERMTGLSAGLCGELHYVAVKLGMTNVAEQYAKKLDALQPTSAREHYSLGRVLLKSNQLKVAEEQFRIAVEISPGDFWANFYRGVAAYRQEHFREAIESFGICIALSPRRAEVYFDRAMARSALGQEALAEVDFNDAKKLDPTLLRP